MTFIDKAGARVALAAVLLMAGAAHAVSQANKCEAAKLGTAGKYDFCRLLAEAKAAKTGGTPDFSKCDAAYSAKWSQAETKAGGMCPSNGDQATVQAFISQQTTALGVALAGGMLPSCGNGVIDPGEQCDQSNLNGQTCVTQGFAAGVLKCGAGCVFDTSGCSGVRFVDNGDGTVSDLQTGLMWEKKVPGECAATPSPGFPIACFSDADCTGNGGGGVCLSCLHCVSANYTWSNSGTAPDGTAFITFLYGLNGGTSPDGVATTGCFASHCDWRLPTIEELNGIIELSATGCPMLNCFGFSFCLGPCIDPAFGPSAGDYLSGTTEVGLPDAVWFGDFSTGTTLTRGMDWSKTIPFYVRAVRGGL